MGRADCPEVADSRRLGGADYLKGDDWATVKWILRYLKDTSGVCLRYGVRKPMLEGFTDLDMSGDVDSSRSTSGYVMTYVRGSTVVAVMTAEDFSLVNRRT